MTHFQIQTITVESELYAGECELRERVLRIPLGMKLRPRDVEGEDQQIHFVAVRGSQVVACVLLQEQGSGIMKIRQMVTDPEVQGSGLGRRIVAAAESWAAQNQVDQLIAHVRVAARGFWMKMGFVAEAGIFKEVGLDHVRMTKMLKHE